MRDLLWVRDRDDVWQELSSRREYLSSPRNQRVRSGPDHGKKIAQPDEGHVPGTSASGIAPQSARQESPLPALRAPSLTNPISLNGSRSAWERERKVAAKQNRFTVRALASVLLFLIVLLIPSVAQAAPPLVRMKLAGTSLRARTGGPVGVRIKLEYNSTQLLEGRLILKVFNSYREHESPMAVLQYDGIVLQGTDYFFNTVLPPLAPSWRGQYEIEGWFETDQERIPLSPSDEIRIPPDTFDLLTYQNRMLVMASVTADRDPDSLSRNRRFLNKALSAEEIVRANPADASFLNFFPQSLSVFDLPEDPLSLCCYDLVLLADESLKQLDAGQTDALLRWVKAGGSVCVGTTGERLAGQHLEFLKQLLPRDAGTMTLDDDGRLLFIDTEDRIRGGYVGLGRTIVLPHGEELSDVMTSEETAGVRGFLWKTRGSYLPPDGEPFSEASAGMLLDDEASFREHVRSLGRASMGDVSNWGAQFGGIDSFSGPRIVGTDYEFQLGRGLFNARIHANLLGSVCSRALLPEDVQMVPAVMLLGILSLYVLAIGPVEYFVLGWLRLRKLTWIVFPLVTVGFTLAIVGLAQTYMGSQDTGGRFAVTDLDGNGNAIRSTEIRLSFAGSQRDDTVETTTSFVVPLGASPLAVYQAMNNQPEATRQLNYAGRFPHNYSVTQRLEQWNPVMTRSFTLDSEASPIFGIDWNNVALVQTPAGRDQLSRQLRSLGPDKCVVAAVLHGEDVWPLVTEQPYRELNRQALQDVHPDQEAYVLQSLLDHPQEAIVSRMGLISATRMQSTEGATLFFQMSPGGSSEMEDLPIFDSQNPHQWVLLILMRTEEGYHLYRRTHYVEDDK